MTFERLQNQLFTLAGPGLPALLLAATLASCGGPGKPEAAGSGTPVTLPATAEGRDSVQEAHTTPARDAASTSADSAAARSSVTPR